MPTEIRVPPLGESVIEAIVERWLKREGDAVAVGEPLVGLETEKVNTEVPAEEAGVLERILFQAGDVVHPGDVLGIIGQAAGSAARPTSSASAAASPSGVSAPATAALASAAPAVGEARGSGPDHDGARATPVAQRVAAELGIDLANIPASGPGGRVSREDVEAFARGASNAPAPATTPAAGQTPSVASTAAPTSAAAPAFALDGRPETRQRLSRRRQTIARRLVEAQRTAAMLTTFNEVDLSAVMELRQRRREAFKERHGVGLGFMGFFVKASVAALKRVPQVNAELQGEELVLKQYYDIGVAIGDKEGLVVPVLRDADRLSFAQIEQAIAGFVQKSRDRALTLDDLRGGTFTITNGGVFGSLLSTPILNPPQVGILGMHKIEDRPIARDGQVVIRPMMYLSLSYDHRVVDGREAVTFLVQIKELLEDPERLFLEG